MKLVWLPPDMYNEPGLFLRVRGKQICLIPWRAKW